MTSRSSLLACYQRELPLARACSLATKGRKNHLSLPVTISGYSVTVSLNPLLCLLPFGEAGRAFTLRTLLLLSTVTLLLCLPLRPRSPLYSFVTFFCYSVTVSFLLRLRSPLYSFVTFFCYSVTVSLTLYSVSSPSGRPGGVSLCEALLLSPVTLLLCL